MSIPTIYVLGLGAGELGQLTVQMYKRIQECPNLYVRTKDHPVVTELEQEGKRIVGFDDIYEKHDQFHLVYEEIVEILCKKSHTEDVFYAVPGHPLVAEKTVELLLAKRAQGYQVVIEGGSSFLDPLFTALEIDPIQGFQLVDGTSFKAEELELKQHMIICQVYDQFVASEVKLGLMNRLPDEYEVVVVTAAGTSKQEVKKVPLYELDHGMNISNLTTVYVPPVQEESLLYQEFQSLKDVIAALRGPGGCPWDQEQTHQSLKPFIIEEAYEVLEAIDEEDDDHLIEELGDVLLQVMLHAQIGEDEGWFTIQDVIRSVTEKMIRRHPHVFGEQKAEHSSEVVKLWDEIKKKETKNTNQESILSGIPQSLPGLLLANAIQKKAAKVGFDWKEASPIWEKLYEEIEEFKAELDLNSSKEKASKELGDILFAIVNVARFYQIDPEIAIMQTNNKFKNRFQYMERQADEKGIKLDTLSLEELDILWEEAKQKE
ncbi:tetrapyrrole methylase family protein/MazG family protein [Bacillus mesophilus]|uniref:Nucleoside triphosphate pyrophosphohydrolase n=1 Tax=Bacillus mesophilus TaxID=1808955 RepID=A0A6M0QCN2_9BACI|nr:nucleoside triphosphate pyrophosphohydrolase [Bacillus mesophilus]MBM7663429.1 tetrapyrrole methylase family protein/MazG family protein [Bacillus mesophilus]NEY74121.1 nucleoside triphosphate pyrophosphohydrolase [Bacillus mesophilus]